MDDVANLLESVKGRFPEFDRLSKAEGFDLGDVVSRYSWVTKDGGKPQLRLAKLNAVEPSQRLVGIDDDNAPVWFTATTFEEDRDGDIVVPVGVMTKNFALNPVQFFGHQELAIPIAKGVDDSGNLLWRAEENRAQGASIFDTHDADAMFIRGKVLRGFLNAVSIAFVPLEAFKRGGSERHKAEPRHEGDKPLGWVFEKVDLTEVSWVGVPANAGAIRDSLDREKSFISPRCQKAYGAYAAQAKGNCFNGWCCPCEKQVAKASTRVRVRFQMESRFLSAVERAGAKASEVERDDEDKTVLYSVSGEELKIRPISRTFDETTKSKVTSQQKDAGNEDWTRPPASKAEWLARVEWLLKKTKGKPLSAFPGAPVDEIYARGDDPQVAAMAIVQWSMGKWKAAKAATKRYIVWAAVGAQPKEKKKETNDLATARMFLSALKQSVAYSAVWIEDTRTGQYIDKSLVAKDVQVIPYRGKFTLSRVGEQRPLYGDDVLFDTREEAFRWAQGQKINPVKGAKMPVRKGQLHDWPSFSNDPNEQRLLADHAPSELAAWRTAQHQHYQPLSGSWTVNERLSHRTKLEAAYSALQRAWDKIQRGQKSHKKGMTSWSGNGIIHTVGDRVVTPSGKSGKIAYFQNTGAAEGTYASIKLDSGGAEQVPAAELQRKSHKKLPTDVGVNRRVAKAEPRANHIPHERGGKSKGCNGCTHAHPCGKCKQHKKDAAQDCVSRKIPIFKKEHPDWAMKHVIAAAEGYCHENKGLVVASGATGGYTVGPTKNDVLACYTRALAAGANPRLACDRTEKRLGVTLDMRKDGTIRGFMRKAAKALAKGAAKRSKAADPADDELEDATEVEDVDPDIKALEGEGMEELDQDEMSPAKAIPHHAQTLAASHSHLEALKDYLGERKADAEPERAAHIDDMVKGLDDVMEDHASTFAKLYPDHDLEQTKARVKDMAGPPPTQGQPEGLEGEDAYTEMDEAPEDEVMMDEPAEDTVAMDEGHAEPDGDEYVAMDEEEPMEEKDENPFVEGDEGEEKGEPDAEEILDRYRNPPKGGRRGKVKGKPVKQAKRAVAKGSTCMSDTHELLRSLADSEQDPIKRAALNHHAQMMKDEMDGVEMDLGQPSGGPPMEGDQPVARELDDVTQEGAGSTDENPFVEGDEKAEEGEGMEQVGPHDEGYEQASGGSGLEELDEDERQPAKAKKKSSTAAVVNGISEVRKDAVALTDTMLAMKRRLGIN